MGVSFLLVTSVYLFPVLVCTGVLPNHQWATGSFATAATQIGGRWLGHWVVLASGISLLAQFFAGVSGESMQLQGIAERQQLPSAFGRQSPYHTPTVSNHFVSHGQVFFRANVTHQLVTTFQYGLLVCLVMMFALLPLRFGVLVELSNFAFCLSVGAEFMAFAQLRIRRGGEDISLSWLPFLFLSSEEPCFKQRCHVLSSDYFRWHHAAQVALHDDACCTNALYYCRVTTGQLRNVHLLCLLPGDISGIVSSQKDWPVLPKVFERIRQTPGLFRQRTSRKCLWSDPRGVITQMCCL